MREVWGVSSGGGAEVKIHDLKCHPEPFRALAFGLKRHEFRKDDRGFAPGDVLRIRCFIPETETLAPIPPICFHVLYVGTGFGIPDGYVCMSLGGEIPDREVP